MKDKWSNKERKQVADQALLLIKKADKPSQHGIMEEAQKVLPENRRKKWVNSPTDRELYRNLLAKAFPGKVSSRVYWSDEEWDLVHEEAVRIRRDKPRIGRVPCITQAMKAVLPKDRWKSSHNSPAVKKKWAAIVQDARKAPQKAAEESLQHQDQVKTQELFQKAQEDPAPQRSEPVPGPLGLTHYLDLAQSAMMTIEDILPRLLRQVEEQTVLIDLLLEKAFQVKDHKPPPRYHATTEKDRALKVAVLGVLNGQAQIIQDLIKVPLVQVTGYKDRVPEGRFDLIVCSRWMSHQFYQKATKQSTGPVLIEHAGVQSIASSINQFFAQQDSPAGV